MGVYTSATQVPNYIGSYRRILRRDTGFHRGTQNIGFNSRLDHAVSYFENIREIANNVVDNSVMPLIRQLFPR
jgi:hypothetical protein